MRRWLVRADRWGNPHVVGCARCEYELSFRCDALLLTVIVTVGAVSRTHGSWISKPLDLKQYDNEYGKISDMNQTFCISPFTKQWGLSYYTKYHLHELADMAKGPCARIKRQSRRVGLRELCQRKRKIWSNDACNMSYIGGDFSEATHAKASLDG
jgi:hypothetical protein